jgi:polar amino acid transport system substrate-binding protein
MKRLMTTLCLLAFGLLAAGVHGAPAKAQDFDAIVKSGELRVGTDVGLPPFGMVDANNQPDGVDITIGKMIADAMGVKYVHVAVTGNNRIAFLQTHKVDIIVSTFSITADRAKAVNFSIPYALQRSVVVAPADVAIKGYDDLLKLKVGVARGTTHEKRILGHVPNLQFTRFDDDAATLTALLSNQVDAIGTNDSAFYALNQRYPDKRFEIKLENAPSYFGVGVNKDSPNLLQWVNTWVFENLHNGNIGAVYKKYMGADMPDLPSF